MEPPLSKAQSLILSSIENIFVRVKKTCTARLPEISSFEEPHY